MASAGAGAHLAGEGDPGAVEGHQEVVDHDGDVVGGQQQHQHHLVLARVAQLAEDRVQGGRRQRRLGVQRGRGRVEAHLVHAATCATCAACPLSQSLGRVSGQLGRHCEQCRFITWSHYSFPAADGRRDAACPHFCDVNLTLFVSRSARTASLSAY